MANFCLFCCKAISPPDNSSQEDMQGKQCIPHFFTLLQRYFGKVQLGGLNGYFMAEMKNLELEGCQHCISILNSFSDAYHKMKCLELHIHWKTYTLIRIMREAGSRGLKRCAPKVRLERLKTLEDRLPPESSSTETELHSKGLPLLSNWISSFAAVLMLLTLSPNNLGTNSAETLPSDCDGEGLQIEKNLEADFFPDGVSHLPSRLQHMTISKETIKCTLLTLKSENDSRSEGGNGSEIADESNGNNESEASSYSNFNAGSVLRVDESNEIGNGNQSACKEELYKLEDYDSDDDNLLAVDYNQATTKIADSKDFLNSEKADNSLFRCAHCFKCFPKKLSLKRHVSRKHSEMRMISKSTPYSCELCVTEYTSYHSYLVHKTSLSHRQKLKRKCVVLRRNVLVDENPIKNPKSASTTPATVGNDLSTSLLTTDFQQVTMEKRYNLREKHKFPVKAIDVKGNESNETSDEDVYDSNFDSSDSLSSSSSCSDKSDNEKSDGITSTIKTEKKKRMIPKGTPILRCPSDACKSYYTVHQKAYEEHMNLHKSGQYQCNFCEVIKGSAFDLSIHELNDHSKITKHPRYRARLYHCPRCEYHTKLRLFYIHHFTRNHLGFTRDSRFETCPICQVKSVDQSAHFRRCHDTTGVEPDKILKCTEENCTAYFTSKRSMHKHKRVAHVLADETSDVEGKLHCHKCVRNFITEYRLKRHNYIFHSKKNLSTASSDTIKKTSYGTMICPAPSCSRNFKRMEALDRHQKLHGNFQCNFCEVVKEYAPDLALHELDHGGTMEKADGAGKWQCPRCAFKCKLQSNTRYVTHHLEAHLGVTDRLYSCGICKMRLRFYNKRCHFNVYHRTDKAGQKTIQKCDKCPAYFLTEKQLQHHKQYICNNSATKGLNPKTGRPLKRQQYKCSISECVESFDNPKSLELHGKLHGDFKCQFCNVSKGYAFDLANHELEHVDADKKRKPFSCARCPLSLSKKGLYLRHFLEAHLKLNARLHSCSICSASYFTKGYIRIHRKQYHNNGNVGSSTIERCDQCPAYFLKKCQLLWHHRLIHNMGVDYRHLKCNVCDKSYKRRGSLRSHLAKFHGMGKSNENFDVECDLDSCKKRFKTKNELDWHKFYSTSHRKRKGQQCSKNHEKVTCHECGKECSGVMALKAHMRVHRKDRPTGFKCDQCDKIFKTKGKLRNHQKFHLGPDKWEFMCSICSKKCFDKWTLQSHMRTHSKEKPFVCQLCGEKYAHRHNLRNHVNSKHKDEGVQDIPKKVNRKYFVSRKGKKLTRDFCFTKAQDNGEDLERNE